ncbi:MAG: hypothetical protein K1X53_13715 [Candidatus Sumerlaeaceae bacterium]|nr:hypothetical protein [Candidatus Sumerlaeaceae bacterium]
MKMNEIRHDAFENRNFLGNVAARRPPIELMDSSLGAARPRRKSYLPPTGIQRKHSLLAGINPLEKAKSQAELK